MSLVWGTDRAGRLGSPQGVALHSPEEPQLLSSAEVSDLSPEAQAHINRPTVPHSL